MPQGGAIENTLGSTGWTLEMQKLMEKAGGKDETLRSYELSDKWIDKTHTHIYIYNMVYIVFNIYIYSITLWDEIFPNGNG
jgi:hypothetical protein